LKTGTLDLENADQENMAAFLRAAKKFPSGSCYRPKRAVHWQTRIQPLQQSSAGMVFCVSSGATTTLN
jgi:hypothetical protein